VQSLQRHTQRRFNCVRTTTTDFTCVCGKKYTLQTALVRHQRSCMLCFKANTVSALNNNEFVLNCYETEDLSYNKDKVKTLFDLVNTEDDRGRARIFNRSSRYREFKELFVLFINHFFFSRPQNYCYYVTDMRLGTGFMYSLCNEQKQTIPCTLESIKEQMFTEVFTTIDDTIDELKLDNEHPFVVIVNTVSTDASRLEHFRQQMYDKIHTLLAEYKNDIKAIWRKVGLI
jgi:hypothetical protein